ARRSISAIWTEYSLSFVQLFLDRRNVRQVLVRLRKTRGRTCLHGLISHVRRTRPTTAAQKNTVFKAPGAFTCSISRTRHTNRARRFVDAALLTQRFSPATRGAAGPKGCADR